MRQILNIDLKLKKQHLIVQYINTPKKQWEKPVFSTRLQEVYSFLNAF